MLKGLNMSEQQLEQLMKKTGANLDLQESLARAKSFVSAVYSDFYPEELLEPEQDTILSSEPVVGKLFNIYDQREKYSLHWAFKNAAVTVEKKQEEMTGNIGNLPDERQEISAQLMRMSRLFTLSSYLISLTDIVISVFLILLITAISHEIEGALESTLLSIVIIAAVALTKVSLDRFFIIPVIDSLGWKKYRKMINRMENKGM